MTACAPEADRSVLEKTAPPNSMVDDDDHRWYIHPLTGRRYVSVTTVLGAISKPSLEWWSADEAAKAAFKAAGLLADARRQPACARPERLTPCACEADRVCAWCVEHVEERWPCGWCQACVTSSLRQAAAAIRDHSAAVGTRLHAIAEADVLGVDTGEHLDWEDVTAAEVAPFVAQFRRFRAIFRPDYHAAEVVVINDDLGYAGTLDAVMSLGWCPPAYKHLVGVPGVADYKTGRKTYREVALQLAAYRHATAVLLPNGEERELPPVEGGFVVHVRPDNVNVNPVECGPEMFDVFCGVLRTWRFLNEDPTPLSRAMYKPRNDPDQPAAAPF